MIRGVRPWNTVYVDMIDGSMDQTLSVETVTV